MIEIWMMIMRKSVWAFLILNLLLSRNQEACKSAESSLTDLSLQVIDFTSKEYQAEEESV